MNDGGPIYPCKLVYDDVRSAAGAKITREHFGMSLRDLFAAAALVADTGQPGEWPNDETRAKWCYRMADAMLAERKRKP